MMHVLSGDITKSKDFVAVDATDLKTREPGLATWTVYRSRDNGSVTAMTTPTIAEKDATNMPGVYSLLMDEDMDMDPANLWEEMTFHITHTGMAPVTITVMIVNPVLYGIIVHGTAQSIPSSTTIRLPASFSASDDVINGSSVHIGSSTNGKYQSRVITDWNNTTKDATVDTWTESPTGTVVATLYATAPASTASPIPVNVTKLNGTTVSPDSAGYFPATIKSGTGTGELNITSGVVNANAVQISGDSTAADNLESYTDGTTPMPVNATQISGDGTAADNLEAVLDGTGGVTLVATAITLTTPITANATQISGDGTAADNLEAVLDGTGGVTLVASAITLTTPITANATQLSGDATAADNAEAFFDGTGYAGTNNVIPSVTTVTGNVNGNVGGNVTGSVGSLAAQAKVDVNAEVVDALATDTYAQPAAVVAATSSIKDKINWMFTLARNKITQTADTQTLRNDADDGSIATSTHADDATTHTRGEWT